MATAVNQQSKTVEKMSRPWATIEALMGGTLTMRDAGSALLTKWPNEEQESYDARLKAATLFPAFERTVSVMAGKPFSKPLTLSEDAPSQVVEWSRDIDKEGANLHAFAADRFAEIMAFGFAGILVEAPKQIRGATGGEPTEREQREAGIRPYWVRVNHSQILGYRFTIVNGGAELTQLRIAECAMVPDGAYGEREVQRVRVLTPGAWELHEEQVIEGKKVWRVVDEGVTGLPMIPFVPLYGKRVAFMVGKPPLENLAFQNVEHWNSKSDQQNILHVARVPILVAKMLGEASITVGASSGVKVEHEHGDVYYAEHTGAAIDAGRQSLKDLEEQMVQSGAELLVVKPGGRTATEDNNDAEGNKCDLQRMAEMFSDALDLALYFTARYAKLAKGGNVTLFSDYASHTLSDASSQLLLGLQQGGIITKATVIREQQRRSVLSADIDPETEIALAEDEGPAAGDLTDDKAAA